MPLHCLVSWCSAGYRLYLKVSVTDKFLSVILVLLKEHAQHKQVFLFKVRSIQWIIFEGGVQ